jgi:chromate reductase
MAEPVTVAAIAGSLRSGSFNRMLLGAAIELAPAAMTIDRFDGLGELPLYDGDVEARGMPAPVARLHDALARADGLLVVTPEYNFSMPGVLKNAIDWASRPPSTSPLRGLPTGVMGATRGRTGTARAQQHFRQSMVFTGTPVMTGPEVLVPSASHVFDHAGRLADEALRAAVADFLARLEAWVRLVGPARRR